MGKLQIDSRYEFLFTIQGYNYSGPWGREYIFYLPSGED